MGKPQNLPLLLFCVPETTVRVDVKPLHRSEFTSLARLGLTV